MAFKSWAVWATMLEHYHEDKNMREKSTEVIFVVGICEESCFEIIIFPPKIRVEPAQLKSFFQESN